MGVTLPLVISFIDLFSTMLMDNHMCIIIFNLRQPIGWLNWYHPSIGYSYFFLSYSLDKQGSTTTSLIGYPTNCWIKMEWVPSLYRVCTISLYLFISTTVVSPYTFDIKPQILSLMVIPLWANFQGNSRAPGVPYPTSAAFARALRLSAGVLHLPGRNEAATLVDDAWGLSPKPSRWSMMLTIAWYSTIDHYKLLKPIIISITVTHTYTHTYIYLYNYINIK